MEEECKDCRACEKHDDEKALYRMKVVEALQNIGLGADDLDGMGGLEGISVAIAGEGLKTDLCSAITDHGTAVADGLNNVANALHVLAKALQR